MDPRYDELATLLVEHSMAVQKGERVLIDCEAVPDGMTIALMRAVRRRGGRPFFRTFPARIRREFLCQGAMEDFQLVGELALQEMRQMQCYVALRGAENAFELGDVSAERQRLFAKAMKPALDYRVEKTRWVVLRWPNGAMAQLAKTSTEAFEDFFFRVCTFDYSLMEPGMATLKARMERTDQVRILSPGTDLRFSIRSIGATPCCGHHNIPDGEIYTAPVRDSVEGTITYNTPSVYRGICFENIRFRFEKGRIVEATASDTAALNAILDSDEGARYVGEFALGVNPHILKPLCDILFDEKIAGSLHFTPGQAYEGISDNGNRSQIHWDLVLIQRPDYGGGEIYFDGELVRKDGLFLPEELRPLNSDRLLSR
ncbi:MAG: aminopeptidase [Puniceicoccales bacterium]|jgi:aminopeptidase|nr:aminopeptidase [Puniceicoccales bacterium]